MYIAYMKARSPIEGFTSTARTRRTGYMSGRRVPLFAAALTWRSTVPIELPIEVGEDERYSKGRDRRALIHTSADRKLMMLLSVRRSENDWSAVAYWLTHLGADAIPRTCKFIDQKVVQIPDDLLGTKTKVACASWFDDTGLILILADNVGSIGERHERLVRNKFPDREVVSMLEIII